MKRSYIRPRGYYDNKGNLLNVPFDTVNTVLSGVTVSANQINYATSFPASCAYAVSAGTSLNSVSASYAASCAYYEPLTNGDLTTPEILYASGDVLVGSVIYV
jgi:hypothetical protein